MTFLYFAYGSNMLAERLAHRCPSASIIGPASAAGHRLTFEKAGADGSGKAMLEADASEEACVPGILFEISLSDLPSLDQAEGAGAGYDRIDSFPVIASGDGEAIMATTYVATSVNQGLKPYDWYLALVIAGARQHDLEEQHLKELRHTEYIIDDKPNRKARLVALRALQSSGHPDHHQLLGS
jgi:hypothetical protein